MFQVAFQDLANSLCYAFVSLVTITCISFSTAVCASTEDFTELSLEELMEVKVNPTLFNVLQSHTHTNDEWMLGYRYTSTSMKHNHVGSAEVSVEDVLKDFPVAPTHMDMDMHMFSLMYAPSDDMTLMLMAPYTKMSMDHLTRKGMRFTTQSEGIGDLEVRANWVLHRAASNRQQLSVLVGLSIPTGSIDERDTTPAGPSQKLPYPMQLGSGTYDLLLATTYQRYDGQWSWGVHADGMVRLGTNDNDYRLGNRVKLSSWVNHAWSDWLSTPVRLDWESWGNINGADPELDPTLIPNADPSRQGGNQLYIQFGLEIFAPSGNLRGQRFGLELGIPLHKNLDGPQMATDLLFTAGWQWIF